MTLQDLIKIELLTLATNEKKAFNGTFYGDGSIYINGNKLMLSDYNTTPNEFRKALKPVQTDFYNKQMDLQDERVDNNEDIDNEQVKKQIVADLISWINEKY
jgi:hypothetical protein